MTRKIDQAIRLLRSYARTANYALAYSGGKDSDVILRLAKLAHIDCEIVHNCTTIDPPGTISHCERAGAKIVRPHYTFFQMANSYSSFKNQFRDFLGGPMVKNLTSKAGDTGSIPDGELRSYMPQGN